MATSPRRRRTLDETAADILSAATAVFSEVPQADVTIEGIADRAGLSKASLYQHFPSRDAIAQAVSRIVTQPDATPVETALAAGDSPAIILDALFLAQAAQVETRPHLAHLVYTCGLTEVCAAGGSPPALLTLMDRIIRTGQITGVFRPEPDSTELAALAYSLLATTILRWAATPGAPSLSHRLHQALDACLSGWLRPTSPVRVKAPVVPLHLLPDAMMRLLDR